MIQGKKYKGANIKSSRDEYNDQFYSLNTGMTGYFNDILTFCFIDRTWDYMVL